MITFSNGSALRKKIVKFSKSQNNEVLHKWNETISDLKRHNYRKREKLPVITKKG